MGIMATKIKSTLNILFVIAILFSSLLASPRALAQAAVPVPFVSALAGDGVAPLATNACTGGLLSTSGSSYSDGCVASAGLLSSPQGAGIDKYGNIYIADYSDRLVRVIYYGGTNVAAAITAANSGYIISATRNAPAPSPVVGDIYTIAGFGGTTVAALTATAKDGKFECANYTATGQPEALNSLGDGCPAASAPIAPRDVTPDSDGNLFLTDYGNSRIRVLCVNCAAGTMAAALIQLEDPGVTPVNGAMYTIAGYAAGYRDGYPGFIAAGNTATTAALGVSLLRSPTAVALSGNDDVYVADNLNNAVRVLYNGGTVAKNILVAQGNTTPQLGYVYTIAGADCVSAATTKLGSVVTANSCLTASPGGTGAAATADTAALGYSVAGTGTAVNVAWTVYLDANDNVYYTDAGNARVKVIYGGAAPPLTFPTTAYPTLQTGYAYSFAGQGSATANGVIPSQIGLSSPQGVGGDANGNIFFIDYGTGLFYETYAQNGITAIIGGGNAIATPAANAFCSGGKTGPAMTDSFYNGCPLTQAALANPRGPLVADANGNLYFGDSVGYFLRKFSYNPTFPTHNIGTTSEASQPYAFTFLSAQTLTAPAFPVSSGSSSDFSDGGGDTCISGLVTAAGTPGTTCVVYAVFSPLRAGLSAGGVVLNSSAGPLGASLVSGLGLGAGLVVDPATSTTTGTGLVLNGIAVDGADRVFVADSASKSVIRYAAGAATTVATGFSAPSGVALDGAGNLFVADSSSNTITEVPIAGAAFTLTSAVSNPHGLATDGLGRLYVADTGNNRILVFNHDAKNYIAAAFAGLDAPQSVAVDANGNLYASDSTHIVKLTTAGVQTTVASGGSFTGLAVDAAGNVLTTTGLTLIEYPADGTAPITLSSALVSPQALALDASGNAFIADSGLSGYVELQRTAGYFKSASNPQSTTINLSSNGNTPLAALTYTQTDTTDFSLAPATTNGCSGALASGATCALTASIAPTVAGTVTDSINFSSNAANAPVSLTLIGTTVSLVPIVSLSISSGSLVYGEPEKFVANVSGTKSISGTVTFLNGTTVLATVPTDTNGNAAYSYQPAVGSYSVTATFTPAGSTTATLISTAAKFVVTQATPTIGLTSSVNSGYSGSTSFVLTATVKSTIAGTPTGTVSFYAGTTLMGTAPLSGNSAALTTTALPAGADSVSAVYSGDTNFVTATSAPVSISVAAGFSVTSSATALTFQQNYQGAQVFLTVTPGGRSDTVAFACQGLPSKVSCAFTPSTIALSGLTAQQTVQLLVSNSNATASLHDAPASSFFATRLVVFAALPFAALLCFGLRRRRLPFLMGVALLMLSAAMSLSGCGTSPTALEQNGGSYNFTATVSSGSTVLQTINYTLTIP